MCPKARSAPSDDRQRGPNKHTSKQQTSGTSSIFIFLSLAKVEEKNISRLIIFTTLKIHSLLCETNRLPYDVSQEWVF